MDEAQKNKNFWQWLKSKFRSRRNAESGQAMIEYVLIVILVVIFARYVYFHPEFGFLGSLERTMMRLGVHLEQDLKSGSKPGGASTEPFEPYVGAESGWTN